ncbi:MULTISPECIES: cupin-like domain-containing protein [unclassified Anabaena]|uniref:cupin-like domain-containing protein n=1 Tax=unclassified Anabaena TaxID=2619674 RepID=UPI0039C6C380
MITTTRNEEITRINNPSQQEFSQLWRQGKPFIIDGVASNWQACKNWSNDYLVDVCGQNQVPVERYPENYFEGYNYAKLENIRTTMSFAEYVDIVEGKTNDKRLYYLAQIDMYKYFPQLMEDIVFLDFFKKEPRDVNLFFGFKNKNHASISKLHFDDVHNIFVQVRGKKRFLLFPHTNYLAFYPPIEDDNYSSTCSKVNPDAPDLTSFPKFPLHNKIEVILNPGEILYIPPFWWHHVTALDENISLTFWYSPGIKDFLWQKGTLAAFLQFAPHVIPRFIRSQRKRNLMLENE